MDQATGRNSLPIAFVLTCSVLIEFAWKSVYMGVVDKYSTLESDILVDLISS